MIIIDSSHAKNKNGSIIQGTQQYQDNKFPDFCILATATSRIRLLLTKLVQFDKINLKCPSGINSHLAFMKAESADVNSV